MSPLRWSNWRRSSSPASLESWTGDQRSGLTRAFGGVSASQCDECRLSAWYRFRKFARRHKTALMVAGLVLFFIALLGGELRF